MSIEHNTENILTMYCAIEEVTRGLELKHSLRPKVKYDFLKEHQHIVKEFEYITLAQLSKNITVM